MSSEPSLRGRALGYLARREHSRLELEKKLTPYASTVEELSSMLDLLECDGFLSAERMVEQIVHIRRNRFGSRRIVYELQQKGIDEELISAVLPRLKETELEAARTVWRKKFGTAPVSATERVKQIRFLMGRGFGTETITQVLDPRNE
ncbi:MAG: recombination regulator RecX [Nitrosomonadaceae bacterium]|jgi:regulatory protein|nr:recombination regulator RecX [Nitrosomonadaceae bacterium]